MPAAEREMAAGVAGIAAQRLAPIGLRMTCGVAVLFEMKPGEIKFVVADDVGWRGRLGGRWRRRLHARGFRRVTNEFPAVASMDR